MRIQDLFVSQTDSLENAIQTLHDSPWKMVIVATGAGAGVQDLLWSVPGASRTLINAYFPYDPLALSDLLTFSPTQYCSRQTAKKMAEFAYVQARQHFLRTQGDAPYAVGLGLTAAVATDRPKKGPHRVCIAVRTRERYMCVDATFETKVDPSLQRLIEGKLCDLLGVNTLLAALGLPQAISDTAGIVSEQRRDVDGGFVVAPVEEAVAKG